MLLFLKFGGYKEAALSLRRVGILPQCYKRFESATPVGLASAFRDVLSQSGRLGLTSTGAYTFACNGARLNAHRVVNTPFRAQPKLWAHRVRQARDFSRGLLTIEKISLFVFAPPPVNEHAIRIAFEIFHIVLEHFLGFLCAIAARDDK